MFERLIKIIGKDKLDRINNSQILLIGVGGVGGYIFNSLVRNGFKNITIIDFDKYELSNLNRQLYSSIDNIGLYKVNVLKDIALSIRKDINITAINVKLESKMFDELNLSNYTYIIDACDTVIVKKLLIKLCKEKNINLLTVCGMGKKLDITKIKICDIKDTSYDPIAKSLRKYIKDEKIRGKVMCVFSSEKPNNTNKEVIASMMPVPSVAGIYAANYILQDIIKK